MNQSDKREANERGLTDESLRSERRKTDHELAKKALSVDDVATDVIIEARGKADTLLDEARALEDRVAEARTPEAQRGFVDPIDNFDTQSRFFADEIEKLLSVECAAHCARCNHFSTLCAKLFCKCGHSRERSKRVLNRDDAELASFVESCAQTGRSLYLVENPNASFGRNVGDDLANRV